jgi:hypothetical protein
MSKLTVKTSLGAIIGDVCFNTGEFATDSQTDHRLYLSLIGKDIQDIQSENAFIDLGLKGTKTDGNVRK